ncbi:hypothetical protein CGZ95_18630 [Enemella evansiae]|uniref:hypothetical protein n=1 Tax=Enemella evansiae TaxID=2016499 RepID=UPI000B96878D|nr:hypothetical protein [Enemella evansiae]OYN93380.1 hypothetical protein CGZ95_18630 [Enemella evansiae]
MALLDFVAPCPYCYTEIDLRKVDFRCLGRPAAGCKACAKEVDTSREREFHDLNEYYPAFSPQKAGSMRELRQAECRRCNGSTGVRLCPQCHSKLPDGFAGDSPMFGLVGARSSGKTVMLAVMLRELATNGPVARRFNHTISLYGAGDENGQANKLRRMLANMEGDAGSLPAQTQQVGGVKSTPVVFEWKLARDGLRRAMGDFKSTVFSFFDTAGEDLATEDRAESMTYLLATEGIILLLDPFAFSGNRGRDRGQEGVMDSPEDVLASVTWVLRQNEKTKRSRKITQPIAVVISKIDAFFEELDENDPIRKASSKLPFFDDAECQSVHDHIAGLVNRWGGDGLLRALDTNYKNYRLFGSSALGAEPNYTNQRVDARGILPHRVAEPLLWLMSERGFIPRKG